MAILCLSYKHIAKLRLLFEMTKSIRKILFLEDSISENMVTPLSRVRKLS